MIPSYKIYDYMFDLCKRKVNLFFLKNLDVRGLNSWDQYHHRSQRHQRYHPTIVSHDQEMLDWDLYSDENVQHATKFVEAQSSCFLKNLNLRWLSWNNVHDSFIITHSEKCSDQVKKYQDAGWITAYFWVHAILALDWYRYAKHDPSLRRDASHSINDFLIYSRGWQGSREYRLCFAQKLIDLGVYSHCDHSMLTEENGIRMQDYTIKDQRFAVPDLGYLQQQIHPCRANGSASADYDSRDFSASALSVVLETNFASATQHLTEKILRPIAVGHPFILVSSRGCLGYLRDYGFTTFNPIIDESYDLEADPVKRLDLICRELHRIANMPARDKQALYARLYQIAEKNRQWFFSDDFRHRVMSEMQQNILHAVEKSQQTAYSRLWLENIRQRKILKGAEYNRQRRKRTPWAPMLSRRFRQRLSAG